MFCDRCGRANREGAQFCQGCGASLAGEAGIPDPLDARATVVGLSAGARLSDRYEVVRPLGRGGMGVVYLVTDHALDGVPLAVKVLTDLLGSDARAVRRLKTEARLAMGLTHPHIVRVNHFEDAGAVKFLVMEYVDGGTGSDALAERDRLQEAEVRRIGAAVADALAHAHHNGVLHRDVKPSNVLLGTDGAIKLADFGIARVAQQALTRMTGLLDSGTLLYLSPELVRGEESTAASDLYALGATLYELASGDPPFVSGDIPDQIRRKPPAPIAGVSDDLNRLLATLLAKDADERPASAATVGQLLRRETPVPTPVDPPVEAPAIAVQAPAVHVPRQAGAVQVSPVDGREMVWIPPGEFLMGSPPNEKGRYSDEGPQHRVVIAEGFWLDRSPVTRAAWGRFVAVAGKAGLPQVTEPDDLPMTKVSWHDAQEYAAWAGKRLPTEAEWEYAARAGTTTAYWWGDEWAESRARGYMPMKVLAKLAGEGQQNPWGLSQMFGNIWEWTSSVYREYPYRSGDGREDLNGSGRRVVRGGAMDKLVPGFLRFAFRNLSLGPQDSRDRVGFRCAQSDS